MSLPPSEPYQAEDACLTPILIILKHTPFTFLCLAICASIGFGGQSLAFIFDFTFWIFFIGAHSPLLIMVHTGRDRWIKELFACPIVVALSILEWVYLNSIPVSESNLAWGAFLPYLMLKIPVCFVLNLIFVAVYFWGAQRWKQCHADPDTSRQELPQ